MATSFMIDERCAMRAPVFVRRSHPLQLLWRRFLHRAAARFGAEATRRLRWRAHGRPCLLRLCQAMELDANHADPEQYCLTWPVSAAKLRLDDLMLLPRWPMT